jgi:hypothetical protein
MTQIQLPIELGDDEESDLLSTHVLERIGSFVLTNTFNICLDVLNYRSIE